MAAREGRDTAKAEKAYIHHKQNSRVGKDSQIVFRELAMPLPRKVFSTVLAAALAAFRPGYARRCHTGSPVSSGNRLI